MVIPGLKMKPNAPIEAKREKMYGCRKRRMYLFLPLPATALPGGVMKSFIDLFFDLWMVHRTKEGMFKKRRLYFQPQRGRLQKGVGNGKGLSAALGRPIPLRTTACRYRLGIKHET